MGYYKNQLKKFEETNLKLWEVMVATEVDAVFCDTINEEEFEIISSFVYDWVINTQMTPNELCLLIKSCIERGSFTIQDIKDKEREVTAQLNDLI